MKVSIDKKPKSLVSLMVEVPWEEVQTYLKRAAKEFAHARTIPGFRQGQASYEVVEQKIGVPALLELASETLVAHTYMKALKEQGFQTVGAPKVTITTRAPERAFEYTAEATIIPDVTLPKWESITVAAQPVTVGEEEVEKLIEELRAMRAKEVESTEGAAQGNKVTVTYQLSQSGVPLEGGADVESAIILGKTQVLPEFAEQLAGMKAGEEKKFEVKFPDTWSRSDLAGRKVVVDMKVKTVARLEPPAFDDAFAKSIGNFEGVAHVREEMKKNITREKEHEEDQRVTNAAVAAVVEKTTFGELPDIMVEAERERVLEEIAARMKEGGITMEQWLERTKKTKEELAKEVLPQAVERVKTLLVMRTIAQQEGIEAEDGEVLKEVEAMLKHAQGDHQLQERIRSHAFHEYLENKIITQKTVEWIKKKVVRE